MRTEGGAGRVGRAEETYELRVEKLERGVPGRVLATVWNLAATLVDGFLPYPATGVVTVRDRRRRTVVHREKVSVDTLDALITALREDLAELDAETFRERWTQGSAQSKVR